MLNFFNKILLHKPELMKIKKFQLECNNIVSKKKKKRKLKNNIEVIVAKNRVPDFQLECNINSYPNVLQAVMIYPIPSVHMDSNKITIKP